MADQKMIKDQHALDCQDKFLQSYLKAIQAFPNEFVFVAAYVGSLLRVKRYNEALQTLQSSRQRFNAHLEWQSLTLVCQVALQKLSDAQNTLQAIDLNSHITAENVNVMAEIAEQAIELKQFDIAFKLVERTHNKFPTHQLSLSLLGLCLRHYENKRYQQLVDYRQHVREISLFDMTIPEDRVFMAELLSQLKTLHTASQQPLEQTLRGGTQTKGKLFALENPVIQKLKEKVEKAINNYIRTMSTENQPILPMPDEDQFEFSGSWSVRLKEEGFHSNHIHPEGWLSSVFYVELPGDVEDEENKTGWLKFGEPNLLQEHHFKPEKYVKPQVGKLVLFPSYYWHGTVPFHSSAFRTTIAFDVALKK
ncbi:MAG: putative 2OG-Fe(II) oxygenase [Aestuariibacter sp.]